MTTQLLHPIPDACQLLGGMSRSTFYEHVQADKIAVVKIGRRTYVAHDELERFVRQLVAAGSGVG